MSAKSLICFILCILCVHGFEWTSKAKVQAWYDNIMTPVIEGLTDGTLSPAEIADKIKMAEDWEEYICGTSIIGRSKWLSFASDATEGYKKLQAVYEVELFDKLQVITEFTFVWTSIDD